MRIGAQLYTVREFCQTLDGLAETLRRVADIGYRDVQVSGSCPYEGAWMAEQLKRNGLRCVLTHTPADRLQNDLPGVLRDQAAFGCKHIGLGWYPFDEKQGYEDFLRVYAPIARAIREGGGYFMYHNHDQEFKKLGGKIILERLMEDIPAEDMGFTLDTFWVQAGGGDPAQWLERLSGRVPCIHLKDYAYGRKMAVVGEGNINFDRVFQKAEAAGTEYMLVEQDDCNGEDPFDCLKRSYDYLKAQGFE